VNEEARQKEEARLLESIRASLLQLDELLAEVNDRWCYEDGVYRFYHQSMKVFYLQETAQRIVAAMQGLAPHIELNPWFLQIVKEGTGREFTFKSNDHWLEETRPIVEAFLHARYFLEMACLHGRRLTEPPTSLPSGYAAVLYLYGIR
jgi:hypothetical protein